MKIQVVVDNYTLIDRYYVGEPAVSYYIEMGGMRILFDVGYSDVFLKNAKAMGIDLQRLTHIVISHGHNDHTGGLAYMCADRMGINRARPDIELIAHPGCFDAKECDGEDIGSPWSQEVVEQCFHYIPAAEPYFLSEHCVFLGHIPRKNGFEGRDGIGMKMQPGGKWCSDTLEDDSALVCRTDKGLFIITGCSHSGICNIVDYAVNVCRDQRIVGILGGFHLFDVDQRLEQTVRFLENAGVKTLYPCHCVSLKAKIKMAGRLHVEEVGVGTELILPEHGSFPGI